MLTEQKYIAQSLELHLFLARIMKEHAIFLEMGFMGNGSECSKASRYKMQFENILSNSLKLSGGKIRNEIILSNEIITDFTISVEEKTQTLTGIPINQGISKTTSQLQDGTMDETMVKHVKPLNEKALKLLDEYIKFKESILQSVSEGKMFTLNYPLLLTHMIREAKLYQDNLKMIEDGTDLDDKEIKTIESFWNLQMMEHAQFIRGLLDPSEEDLMNTADGFAKDYKKLIDGAKNSLDITLNNNSLAETIKYKEFKEAGTKGIFEGNIKSVIIPLLADHLLREANHYIRTITVKI